MTNPTTDSLIIDLIETTHNMLTDITAIEEVDVEADDYDDQIADHEETEAAAYLEFLRGMVGFDPEAPDDLTTQWGRIRASMR